MLLLLRLLRHDLDTILVFIPILFSLHNLTNSVAKSFTFRNFSGVLAFFLRKFSVFKRFVDETVTSPSGFSVESYMLYYPIFRCKTEKEFLVKSLNSLLKFFGRRDTFVKEIQVRILIVGVHILVNNKWIQRQRFKYYIWRHLYLRF